MTWDFPLTTNTPVGGGSSHQPLRLINARQQREALCLLNHTGLVFQYCQLSLGPTWYLSYAVLILSVILSQLDLVC